MLSIAYLYQTNISILLCKRQREDALGGGIGSLGNGIVAHAVGFGETLEHKLDVGTLVALSAHGYGSHVWRVGFYHDAVERHSGWQHFGQMTLLEGEYTADAKHEAVELQQFFSLVLVAGEAVEHAARQVVLVAA